MFVLISKSFLVLNSVDFEQGEEQSNRVLIFDHETDTIDPIEVQWSPKGEFKIIAGCFSGSENRLALCDDQKNLIVFDRQFKQVQQSTAKKNLIVFDRQFNPIRQLTVKKNCVKILFNDSEDIIFCCDRSGDVYEFKLNDDESEAKLLLGHCSMLLDFVITRDQKYIISCDRDEKIRVTHYPNTYNIESYCLGHTEFVSSIKLIDSETLVSGSGDGRLIVWDFVNGKKLFTFPFDSPEDKNNSEYPIKSIAIDQEICHYLAVSFYKMLEVVLFRIERKDNRFSALTKVKRLNLNLEPVVISFQPANSLWIVGGFEQSPLRRFVVKEDNDMSEVKQMPTVVARVNQSNRFSQSLHLDCCKVDSLFKHYYNNVEVYYRRKLLRTTPN